MSLTSEAYEERRWEGLAQLKRLLTGAHGKPDYSSSVAYTRVARISDLLHIFGLCDENLREISISGRKEFEQVNKELERLQEEMKQTSDFFQFLSKELKNIARSIELDDK